ncbi:MAG: PDZ domain-containing protein [Anaerolineales bacterium]
MQIDAQIAQIYHCFSTLSGWLDWFAEKGFGYVTTDSVMEFHLHKTGKVAFLFQELEKNVRVRFRYINLNLVESSDVEIGFEETAEGVTISLVQEGIPPEKEEEYQSFWEARLNALKAIFETGRDPRLWDRPFLGVTVADWVTPEYAAEHSLATESGMHLNSVFEGRGAEQAGIQDNDVIVSLAGQQIENYDDLQNIFAQHRAGDTLDVSFYHKAELKHSRLTLSLYPVPEVPANAQDIAEKLERLYQQMNKAIEQLLHGKLEAQMEYRPSAGEWNAKEILAHLIAYESDSFTWLNSYIVGQEVHLYTANNPATIKTLTVVYPTMEALLKRYRQSQQELVTLLTEVPSDVVNRKTSMLRLALSYSVTISMHYKEHLNQLKETLEAAADVRGS